MHGAPADSIERESRRHNLRLGLGFLLLVPVLLAALALWFGTEYQRLARSEGDIQNSHSRQLLMTELFSSLKDAETGQRGFVITGDEAFLQPYREGRKAALDRLRKLSSQVMSEPERRRLARMARLIEAKFIEMERVVDLRASQGLIAATAAVSQGNGKRLMDQIRVEATRARAVETALLARTLARRNEQTQSTERVIWIVVFVIALAFVLLGLLFWRNERHRRELGEIVIEAASRRRAIFDSTLDAIILINPSGSIETINQSAAKLFGYSDEQLIRRDISLIVDLAPGEGSFLERIGLGPDGLDEPFRHSLAAHCADGRTIPVEAALGLMPLPDGIHIVAALRDISEREKTEQIKDQFLSTVSHELRTPLTSIVGSLGLLRGGASGELSAGAQRLLVIAENNANRLIRLVNDLLDIEKLESGAMSFDFQPIDLRDVAKKALDAVRGMAQVQDVALEIDPDDEPVMVRGDAERLIQVFNNLLGNAIRFTPPGRKVSLSVKFRAHHAEASVTDEGPGVDDAMKARLFTRFAQSVQTPAGQSRGTGLGLAISREIVRNHGGSIGYNPAPGGGSTFTFNLPVWNTVTDQPDAAAAPRVLICASKGEAGPIAAALGNKSIRADVVDTADSVMQALDRRRYLALLLDCHQLTGDSRLLQDIHGNATTRNLPIIAIAGGEEDTAELAWLDVVDWIPRPLDPERLGTALASVAARAAHKMPLILHVDDDTDTLEITAAALAGRARMARAADIASARALIARDHPDVVIVDLALPDGSGEELLSDLTIGGDLATPVIIYSAQERNGSFAREVSAVLTKSRRSLSALVETINEILDRQQDGKGGRGNGG